MHLHRRRLFWKINICCIKINAFYVGLHIWVCVYVCVSFVLFMESIDCLLISWMYIILCRVAWIYYSLLLYLYFNANKSEILDSTQNFQLSLIFILESTCIINSFWVENLLNYTWAIVLLTFVHILHTLHLLFLFQV